jgi:hypothetical protein
MLPRRQPFFDDGDGNASATLGKFCWRERRVDIQGHVEPIDRSRGKRNGKEIGSEALLIHECEMIASSKLLFLRPQVSGRGLALAGVSIEQDSAYWEAHIVIPGDGDALDIMLGVATKKDRKYYNAMEEQEEGKFHQQLIIEVTDEDPSSNAFRCAVCAVLPGSLESNGTDLMRKIKVSNGDTIGIAVQQCDLPMVQFLLNGEPLNELAVNRFRGTVYPSVFLPENEGLSVRLAFNENDFQQMTPHARYGPLLAARGLM